MMKPLKHQLFYIYITLYEADMPVLLNSTTASQTNLFRYRSFPEFMLSNVARSKTLEFVLILLAFLYERYLL